jgi:hypothetical protein
MYIQKHMTKLNKCRVVLLDYKHPMDGIVIHKESNGNLCLMNSSTCRSSLKQICIVSDDSVYIDDYYISVHSKSIRQSQYSRGNVIGGKVIASTNKSLGLPKISDEILERILESYNIGKPIEFVNVEYDTNKITGITKSVSIGGVLKAQLIKDNWNREEVIELLKSLVKDCGEFEFLLHHEDGEYKELDNWINKKL